MSNALLAACLKNNANFKACPETVQTLVFALVKKLSENWDNWDEEAQFCFCESLFNLTFCKDQGISNANLENCPEPIQSLISGLIDKLISEDYCIDAQLRFCRDLLMQGFDLPVNASFVPFSRLVGEEESRQIFRAANDAMRAKGYLIED